ncbi:MAG: InlB B-repeat-containing protein, partial [Spirochaetota bacterium]|nr:InlB B-repeat-containing protein [Spirochaetota bacterium]
QIVIMKGDYCTLWETVSVEAGKENKLADKNITSQKSDASSFIWQGSSATPPANPEKYWAYFNTTDGCSYIYDGEKWTLLAQAGKDGIDGENGNGGGASVEHKITYELNGGTNSPYNPNLFLEYLTVNLKSPTRDGYCFAGWYENADFSGNRIKGWEIGEKRTDVTLYAKWIEKAEADASGFGVYSYTLNIEDISTAWGGTTTSPTFSIFLLTDEQVEVCKAAINFKQAPADNPEYQLGAYGDMKITDTSKIGDYAVYGANPINDVYQYYNGVAATITNTTFTLTVDMTKLDKTQLKALFAENGMVSERPITEDDMVYLLDYKPYVIALGDYLVYEDNYVFTAWSADVMKMEEGATFPTELIEDDPKIQVSEMKFVCSNFGYFPITFSGDVAACEITYALANAAWGQKELAGIEFGICSDVSWAQKFTGAAITALDTEVEVTFGADNNNTVAADILEDGKTYVLTINAKNNTVKISAK